METKSKITSFYKHIFLLISVQMWQIHIKHQQKLALSLTEERTCSFYDLVISKNRSNFYPKPNTIMKEACKRKNKQYCLAQGRVNFVQAINECIMHVSKLYCRCYIIKFKNSLNAHVVKCVNISNS